MPHDRPPKEFKQPPALQHFRATLTEESARREFCDVYKREPRSDGELAMFVELYTLELYNSGYDEWPKRDPQKET